MMSWLKGLVGKGDKNIVRVVRLAGSIQTKKQSLNLLALEKTLDKAFDTKKVTPLAVALEINCPGGSPTQTSLLFNRIRNLSEEKQVPVYSFVEDVAASGGYWLACAGDEIYAERTSLVGSIGVISIKFGAVEAVKNLGVELRVQTAGKSKFRFDPTKPVSEEDRLWSQSLLNEMHTLFIDAVVSRRPALLKTCNNDPKQSELFSGEVYTGAKALTLGLVDHEYTDMRAVMREKFGKDVKFNRISVKKSWQDIINPTVSMKMADATSTQVEEAATQQYKMNI